VAQLKQPNATLLLKGPLSVVEGDRILRLRPVMSVAQFLDLVEPFPPDDQRRLL
jgi:hypothetical protein